MYESPLIIVTEDIPPVGHRNGRSGSSLLPAPRTTEDYIVAIFNSKSENTWGTAVDQRE